MNQNTAILIFANSAKKEVERKSFLSIKVFSELNQQILKTAGKTKLPYFHFSEKQQVGNSFGERFTNAIETVINKGFKNVIVIGNDTPHLTTKHIFEAVGQLENNDLVLGPSKDGGFYLMGVKKEHFNKNVFLNLPWQTSSLLISISKGFELKNIDTYYLNLLSDIDTLQDVKPVLESFISISIKLKELLLQIIFINKKLFSKTKLLIQNPIQNLFLNKGSPLFI